MATFLHNVDAYRSTSVLLGESGLALALDRDRLSGLRSVLTPAAAMGDVLLSRLPGGRSVRADDPAELTPGRLGWTGRGARTGFPDPFPPDLDAALTKTFTMYPLGVDGQQRAQRTTIE